MQKLLLLALINIITLVGANAQKSKLEKFANQFVKAVTESDLEAYASHYADKTLYIDKFYGSEDYFDRETIKSMMAGFFNNPDKFKLEIQRVAIDENTGSIALLGDSYDPDYNVQVPFTTWIKVKNGKIVEQRDYVVYAINSLKMSPRFKHLFSE